ncbi:Abi family protein [Leuconostoc gelidum subsp. gasicomitatum]|uniref:Abi family protein n=1 Tax=Leuconostoc gasicomitatum TaxID=115778 RepID=UPI001CC3C16B|nr:Abi family protein [Leuconostoc gasicomitatum]MBZ5995341.1 Abi family protein [Leuconostoc gasicomitatum]
MPDNLDFEHQLSLLESRGMIVPDEERTGSINKLTTVSYYRIKEFAKPFEVVNDDGKIYDNLEFSKVLARYYQDKNLRMSLLHAIEQIEVSIKTQLAYALGTRYGAFGYLDFSNWIDRSEFDAFQTLEKQYYFTKELRTSARKSNNADLHNNRNLNTAGIPSVWLGMNILTFGQMCNIIFCSKNEIVREIALNYKCTNKQLISWLGTLNLVRNVCAHNGNLVNISLKTKPILNNELENKIHFTDEECPVFKLGVIIVITKIMVRNVNSRYQWDDIRRSLKSLCVKTQLNNRDEMANIIGFKNFNIIKSI